MENIQNMAELPEKGWAPEAIHNMCRTCGQSFLSNTGALLVIGCVLIFALKAIQWKTKRENSMQIESAKERTQRSQEKQDSMEKGLVKRGPELPELSKESTEYVISSEGPPEHDPKLAVTKDCRQDSDRPKACMISDLKDFSKELTLPAPLPQILVQTKPNDKTKQDQAIVRPPMQQPAKYTQAQAPPVQVKPAQVPPLSSHEHMMLESMPQNTPSGMSTLRNTTVALNPAGISQELSEEMAAKNQSRPVLAAGPYSQGLPMNPPGNTGPTFSAGNCNPGSFAHGSPRNARGPTRVSKSALQDYQLQLMLLEQQNKKRLLMARQSQDIRNNIVASEAQAKPQKDALSCQEWHHVRHHELGAAAKGLQHETQQNRQPAGNVDTPDVGKDDLMDYQLQLILLEQQNKRRLLMAREQAALHQQTENPESTANVSSSPSAYPLTSLQMHLMEMKEQNRKRLEQKARDRQNDQLGTNVRAVKESEKRALTDLRMQPIILEQLEAQKVWIKAQDAPPNGGSKDTHRELQERLMKHEQIGTRTRCYWGGGTRPDLQVAAQQQQAIPSQESKQPETPGASNESLKP